jgi:hypothetical protein
VPNYKMAKPGHSFSEGRIDLSWGIGRESSDVISLSPTEQSARFKQRVLAGVIVETKDPVTDNKVITDTREYRLMTGDEARAHKAIPAGPVTRNVFNPVTGELMSVEIGSTRILEEPAEVAAEPEDEAPDSPDETEDQPADPADSEAMGDGVS